MGIGTCGLLFGFLLDYGLICCFIRALFEFGAAGWAVTDAVTDAGAEGGDVESCALSGDEDFIAGVDHIRILDVGVDLQQLFHADFEAFGELIDVVVFPDDIDEWSGQLSQFLADFASFFFGNLRKTGAGIIFRQSGVTIRRNWFRWNFGVFRQKQPHTGDDIIGVVDLRVGGEQLRQCEIIVLGDRPECFAFLMIW